MSRRRTPPPGFESIDVPGAVFWCDPELVEPMRDAGFERAEIWTGRLERGGAGRGAHGRWSPGGGRPDMFLKAFRRGGAVARFGDRFAGPDRFVATLRATSDAVARGVATPRPRALWFERRGLANWRGFLALDWLDGETWGHALAHRPEAAVACVPSLAACVARMHDAGVFHADLNVDNLMLDGDAVRVLDLDRARVGAPLADRPRAENLARLERSYGKRCGRSGPLENGFAAVWKAYREATEGRPDVASERLARRSAGRRGS